MSFTQFLKSKPFFLSVLGAVIIFLILGFGALQFLSVYTQHGKEIKVPNLAKLKPEAAAQKLEELGLEMVILDTIDFNKDFPPLTVVSQDPVNSAHVKEGRKVYVKINAKNFSSVRLPNLVDNTFRFAISRIEALGLVKGEVRYEPHLAKDVVIQVEQEGRILKEGDKVLKNSKIDFVLGDGSLSFKPAATDTINDAFEDVAPKVDSIY